ncbi:MAG: hypothetical protein GY756_12985 [bacterium]|nr:hypothetical protein [bacterium]
MKRYYIFISFLFGLSLIVNAADSSSQKSNFDPVKSIVKPGSTVAQKNLNANQKSIDQQQGAAKKPNQAISNKEFKNKIIDLENQRRKVSLQIYEYRVQLIQKDPNLRILHKTIVDLHEKMAKQLNGNAKMETYLAQAKKIDGQITQLIAAKAKEMSKKK